MAIGVTSTVQVDPEVNLYFDNILLDRHQPYYVYGYFAQERRIPQKNSKNAIFRRFDNLADALTPLTEGVTPPSEQVSKFDITAVVSQYGNKNFAVVKPSLIDLDLLIEEDRAQAEQFALAA